ncbi:MAG: nitroreductase, partial [Candidatus Eisenbacteria bacterium]|nr:nitroreductase [Candidatus Latescibacterota bacterium]MBD3302488.1 nitroreductase [Candidatus Eisenbacteria bacterium]
PKTYPTYRIYHFFASDPEGRPLEFQSFDPPVMPHLSGDELLRTRRSIRRYTEAEVPDDLIRETIEECALAPSSHNSQPCTFVTVRDREKRERLAALREDSSAPIGRAPAAIAVCADPDRTGRPLEDGCIAGTYLLLAAWNRGLGTCWIGGMDREDVKEILGVPAGWIVAMITPIGWPAVLPDPPERVPVRSRT